MSAFAEGKTRGCERGDDCDKTRGYESGKNCRDDSGDVLTAREICGHIKTTGVFSVEARESVASTNTLLRELAAQGAPEGLVVAAERQTAGKGRLGRRFHSPPGHGVYFSLLLRPGRALWDAALVTSAAAVAAARAIEETVGVRVGIKWVNDLFLDGKKVCGILTEATLGLENSTVLSAVVGIGINVTMPEEGFPEELDRIAAALHAGDTGVRGERCRLIAATLDNFWAYYRNLPAREFLDEYRARSIVLGRDIQVISPKGETSARALAIDDDCRLVVRYEDGSTAALGSGEISVRPI